jgi:hypothetical protein
MTRLTGEEGAMLLSVAVLNGTQLRRMGTFYEAVGFGRLISAKERDIREFIDPTGYSMTTVDLKKISAFWDAPDDYINIMLRTE